ncbi:S-methyl-5-thioribose-1-phosphate isomerase [Roseimarinus sediminis]|uniref:S-methyl-5-thioribose-1-phosphate isomerase n=1 Tax=Roseimarinus sediminis TaxID=1610899 RepID=UPI003D198CF2
MLINGQHFQTIWLDDNNQETVKIIDQQKLPFQFSIKTLHTFDDAFNAIKNMTVRGAPLIGVTAAYGIYLALCQKKDNENLIAFLQEKYATMKTARPTAVNLAYAVDVMAKALTGLSNTTAARNKARKKAAELKQLEIDYCSAIGDHGLQLIEDLSRKKQGEVVNVLTHCNAGWLACIDWGTALAPLYKAQEKGIKIHVWVDETRPRNQGSKLTAFELRQQGIAHTVIPDNTGGHLMQHGMVDVVLVGSDRTTRSGDVCNKIGTYLKALAARDNKIPFYVALPSSSIDFSLSDGISEIPIEERNADEVKFIEGKSGKVQIVPDGSPVANYGFDVTPARLVTALITEAGVCGASEAALNEMFLKK